MSTTTTPEPVDPTLAREAVHNRLNNITSDKLAIFTNWKAIAELVDQAERSILARIGIMGTEGGSVGVGYHPVHGINTENAKGPLLQYAKTEFNALTGFLSPNDLSAFKAMRALVEASPELAAARAEIEPLLAEAEAAKAAEREATDAILRAKDAHAATLERLKAEAMAKALAAPEVGQALTAYEAALQRAPVFAERQGLVAPKPEPALDVPLVRGKNLATA